MGEDTKPGMTTSPRGLLIAKDRVLEPLYVIVPVFNPWRWKSRWKHTVRALKHFHDSGAVIVLVEIAFNRREFVFQDLGLDGLAAECGIIADGRFKHRWIGLRSKEELWLKEAAINAGVTHLPHDWQQVAWLDSDVQFARPNWVGECIQKLQHYAFLQMFSHARDLGPNYEMLADDHPHANGRGFIDAFQSGALDKLVKARVDAANRTPSGKSTSRPPGVECKCKGHCECVCEPDYGYGYPPRVFPGLAWAARREAWDAVGGLLDIAIWGGGDWHMAHALIEKTEGMMRNDLHRDYKKQVMQWYYRCHTHIRQNVGVMEGTILHNWHGRKTDRGYNAKHHILAQCGFDPLRHLKRDSQGLWQLHDDRSTAFVKIRDMMRQVARERNEDGTEV
jgi:hypothetical protein